MEIDLDELKRLAEDGSPGEFEANVGPDAVLKLIAEIERLQSECDNELKGRLDALSDDQRLELFGRYCAHCGCKQPESGMRCQCWNDE